MTLAESMLSAGMDVITDHFPSVFTVDGESGSFTGAFAPTSVSESPQLDGTRGKSTGTLTFSNTTAYVPANGDRITVGGSVWVVALVGGGAVVWELALISEDE